MILLLGKFVDLAELVHVKLTDEGREVLVPEIVGEHFFLQFFP